MHFLEKENAEIIKYPSLTPFSFDESIASVQWAKPRRSKFAASSTSEAHQNMSNNNILPKNIKTSFLHESVNPRQKFGIFWDIFASNRTDDWFWF